MTFPSPDFPIVHVLLPGTPNDNKSCIHDRFMAVADRGRRGLLALIFNDIFGEPGSYLSAPPEL